MRKSGIGIRTLNRRVMYRISKRKFKGEYRCNETCRPRFPWDLLFILSDRNPAAEHVWPRYVSEIRIVSNSRTCEAICAGGAGDERNLSVMLSFSSGVITKYSDV